MAYLLEAIDKIGKVVGSGKKILDTVNALNGLGASADGTAAGSAAKATAQALSSEHGQRIRSLIEQQLSELRVKEALKAQLARAETELLELTSQWEQKSLVMAGALSAVSLYTLYLYYCTRSSARTIEQMRAERLEVERNFHVKSLTFHQQKLDLCFWLLRHRDSSDPAIRSYVVRMLENGHMGGTALPPPQVRRLLEGAPSAAATPDSDPTSSLSPSKLSAATLSPEEDDDDTPTTSSSSSSIGGSTLSSILAALSPTTSSRSKHDSLNLDDFESDSHSVAGSAFDERASAFSDDLRGALPPLPSAADFDSLPLPIPLDISEDITEESASSADLNSSARSESEFSDRSSTESAAPSDTSSAEQFGDEPEDADAAAASSDGGDVLDAFQSASSLAEAFSGPSPASAFHSTATADATSAFQPTATSLGSYDLMALMCSDFSTSTSS